MLSQNQYITLTSQGKDPTLKTCDLKISLTKNNEYYFNSSGIYIDVLNEVGESILDRHIKWVPPKHNEARIETPVIETEGVTSPTEYLKYVTDEIDLSYTINLLRSDVENRMFFSNMVVRVFYNFDPDTGAKKILFEHAIRLESIALPLPRLHEFNPYISSNYTQEELDQDILKIVMLYKSVLPHYEDKYFYTLEILSDYSPGEVLYATTVDSAAAPEYEVPVIARGETVTLTINIYRSRINGPREVYVSETRQVITPRAKYQSVFVKTEEITPVKALYTKAITGYTQENVPIYNVVNVKNVYIKQGGVWYTE